MKLISREFSIQKLYIGPIPSIHASQCTKLTASSSNSTFISHLYSSLYLRECTGMFMQFSIVLLFIFFPTQVFNRNLFTNCKAKFQWMYFLYFYLFIYIYFKYIHVPTINQVFSFILWLDHHSVSFLLLAPIMGLSWSFGPRQLKTILLLLGV